MTSEIQREKDKARKIWLSIFPRGLGGDIPRVTKGVDPTRNLPSAFCPEHWQNIAIFGHCWKHNTDGTMKSLFAKNRTV
jgi:hypothetical protein